MDTPDITIARLSEVDCSAVPRFSFDQIQTYARVCNVHDADTVTIVFEWMGALTKINIRLDGIDAPELRSKKITEVQASQRAQTYLSELINNKVVQVSLGKFDKYGRILGRVFTLDSNICVNDHLIDCQYVRKYGGGKKEEWTQGELDRIGSAPH